MFAFPNAEGGSYIVEATLLGFTPSEMVVDAGSNAPIVIILAVGTFAQEVTVTALMPELATEMVVPASQIERRVAQDLARSLRSHAGVTALRRGAINLDPSVRGLYAEQIGVFVDGTRTFAAGPARMDSALSHISPHALQSLRVVRGPYALTWGAGTLSAIQAETFKPAFGGGGFRLGGRVGVNYGSNGSAGDGFAGLWGSSDRVRFTFQHNSRIGSDYTDGDGNRVPGHYESFDTRWNAGVRLGTRTLLEYSGGYQRQNDIDYPGRILDATFFDTQSHALDVSHTPAAGILTELAGQVYLNLKDHLMNNDAKPTAQRNPHRTPPFPIRVDLPTSSDTRGGRFHAALETGPLRYKMGLDAYRLQQSATQTVSDRDTGQIHHTMHPVWPNADQTNLGGYAQVLWDQGRSTIGGTVRIDREQAQIGQVTSFFAHNAIPVYALHEVHGQFHCVTAVCMPQMSHDTGTGHMADTHTGHDAATATMDHGAALDHGATMGHAGYGATMLVSGDRFAQTNTNVSAAANASLRMTDTWLVTLGVGRAVRSPSVLERYADRFPAVKFQTAAEFVGNPTLLPEKSLEFNAGTTFRAAEATVGLDIFVRHVDDYITVAADPNLEKRLQQYAIELHDPARTAWVELQVTNTAAQERVATARLERVTAGWTTIDLLGGVEVADGVTIRAGVQNLTDEYYVNHLNALNPFAGQRIAEVGRSAYIGLEYGF